MSKCLKFALIALVLCVLLVVLRWSGQHKVRPGENDFDPIAAAVVLGSIALAAPAAAMALSSIFLSLVAFARRERPVVVPVAAILSVGLSAALFVLAWTIGP